MYLLIDEKGRHYLVKGNADVHTNYGVIKAEQFTDKNVGKMIEAHTGRKYFLVKPGMIDYLEKAKRGPQTISLKDCGIVAAYTGIKPGCRVLDCGTGSGIMSMFLANLVYPETLISYEVREDFAAIAKENFERTGIANIRLEMRDIYEGIGETELDVIHLDVPEPWKVIEHAKKALKVGGFLVSYSPSIEQNKKFYDSLTGFESETVECLVRGWDMKVVRPHSRMLSHTGFMTFARLIRRELDESAP
jgi:tRNA (adenine57-N1/adenine58-N1)-methyltransferase